MTAGHPPLPLVRRLSRRVTPLLARLPISANQITAASMVVGLAGAGLLSRGERTPAVVGGLLLVVAYVLDNCDGEIARIKHSSSEFGKRFDSFADWVVHVALFAGLGLGAVRTGGDDVWLWLGWIAAAGSTINYGVAFVVDLRAKREGGAAYDPTGRRAVIEAHQPRGWKEWTVFSFRELARADFCFLVLALALADATWLLLPAGAVGAHIYWATQLIRGSHEYHV